MHDELTRSFKSRRVYCPDCGFPRRAGHSQCQVTDCGSFKKAVRGFVKPTRPVTLPYVEPPHPWGALPWPENGVFLLSGGEGLGKSSIAGLLHNPDGEIPTHIGAWITAEQDPGETAAMFARLKRPCPPIYPCDPGNPLAHALEHLKSLVAPAGHFVIVDSVTELGMEGAVAMTEAVIEDCRKNGRRGLLIAQNNSEGEVAGRSNLKYKVQIRGEVARGAYSRRVFRVTKSRYGAEFSAYYKMFRDGTVGPPNFGAIVHSIEGELPRLDLVPYGFARGSVAGGIGKSRSGKIQYAGLLDQLAHHGILPELAGCASAANPSPATMSGFLCPEDVGFRRALAEQHGLRWLPLEVGIDILAEAEEAQTAARKAETPWPPPKGTLWMRLPTLARFLGKAAADHPPIGLPRAPVAKKDDIFTRSEAFREELDDAGVPIAISGAPSTKPVAQSATHDLGELL